MLVRCKVDASVDVEVGAARRDVRERHSARRSAIEPLRWAEQTSGERIGHERAARARMDAAFEIANWACDSPHVVSLAGDRPSSALAPHGEPALHILEMHLLLAPRDFELARESVFAVLGRQITEDLPGGIVGELGE
jgi:hypothetical protein